MVNLTIVYQGQLHCSLTHESSGTVIQTDAPKDNSGKGEAFSPTDLVAAALGSCMLTVMGIEAVKHAINLSGSRVKVSKEMTPAPLRRIARIAVVFQMAADIPQDKRLLLETAAHACPVHRSLHPDLEVSLQFIW